MMDISMVCDECRRDRLGMKTGEITISEAAIIFLEQVAFTALHTKGATLGRALREMSPSIAHRIARTNGVDVDENGRFRCPHSGEFTDVFGSNCVTPSNSKLNYKKVAESVFESVEAHTINWTPGEVTDPDALVERDRAVTDAARIWSDLLEDDSTWNRMINNVGGHQEFPRPLMVEVLASLPDAARAELGEPTIVIRARSLLRVLGDGRWSSALEIADYLSQFKDMSGVGDMATRKAIEQKMGIPEDAPDFLRPIYGFSYDAAMDRLGPSRPSLARYGDVVVHLKPGAMKKSTVSFGDTYAGMYPVSWERLEEGTVTPKDIAAAASGDWLAKALVSYVDHMYPDRNVRDASRSLTAAFEYDFTELQYHGGLTVPDIDYIEFPDMVKSSHKELQELRDALDMLDIKHNLPEDLSFSASDDTPVDVNGIMGAAGLESPQKVLDAGQVMLRYLKDDAYLRAFNKHYMVGRTYEEWEERIPLSAGPTLEAMKDYLILIDGEWESDLKYLRGAAAAPEEAPFLVEALKNAYKDDPDSLRELDLDPEGSLLDLIEFLPKDQRGAVIDDFLDAYEAAEARIGVDGDGDGIFYEGTELEGLASSAARDATVDALSDRSPLPYVIDKLDDEHPERPPEDTEKKKVDKGRPPTWKLLATEGSASLWDVGNGMGVVTDPHDQDISKTPIPIGSILQHGYWEPAKGKL